MKTTGAILAAILLIAPALSAQNLDRKEIPIGHAPADLLKETVEKHLSNYGSFVILQKKGTVLVIDFADKIREVETALSKLEVPQPEVLMNFAFRNGVNPPREGARPFTGFNNRGVVRGGGGGGGVNVLGPVNSTGDFPFPTRWDPPRIAFVPGYGFAVIPAHPRNFVRRNVGVTLETEGFVNPDGTISLNINHENTEFQGFINYGSAILVPGANGVVPVLNNAANPRFFQPWTIQNKILVPIFDTTRIQTQIIVRPRVGGNQVRVDMIPQLKVIDAEADVDETISLTKFATSVTMENGEVGIARGFNGASSTFNRNFLGEDPEKPGSADIMIKAQIRPASSKDESAAAGGENDPSPETDH